jgi:TPR repeat protein
VQVQPTANKEVFKSGDAAICVESYGKQQWENARTACFRAAEQGDVTASLHVAHMYKHGYGINQDNNLAVRWYTLAAEKGNATSQWILGRMYLDGDGVAKNHAQALHWLTLVSEQNSNDRDLVAMVRFDLGRGYRDGLGVPQDYVRAHMWINLSAAIDRIGAYRSLRDDLERRMTREQIAKAQQMANDCVAKNYKKC